MEVIYSPKAIEDLKYWKKSGNKIIQKRISALIDAIQQNPYGGIGKPEPLKYALSGFWSRRITQEHRLVYRIEGDVIEIAQLRYHY